jgi:hypothetical protein
MASSGIIKHFHRCAPDACAPDQPARCAFGRRVLYLGEESGSALTS